MRALLALVLWSLLICAVLALLGYLSGGIGSADIENLLVVFGASLVAGYVLLLAFAVPVYTWFSRSGRVGWTSVLLIGIAPGLALLMVSVSWLGLFLLVSGLVVAIATHLMVVKGFAARSNNSLERTREG